MRTRSFISSWTAAVPPAALVLGWSTFDLCLLVSTGGAALIPGLLLGYLVAIGIGLCVGLLASLGQWICAAIVLLSGAAALIPASAGLSLPAPMIGVPRASALLLAGIIVSRALAGVFDAKTRFWPSMGLGLIAAAIFATIYSGLLRTLSLGALITGFMLLAAPAIADVRVRRLSTAAAIILLTSLVGAFAVYKTGLDRADYHPVSASPASAPGPNLILIVLDTVSARHLAPYGYKRVTTPGIDAFVRKHAIRYTQARSVSSWTLPAHASIFTGLYPSQHGADHLRIDGDHGSIRTANALHVPPAEPMRGDVPTLAAQLLARGYQTGAIVGNCGYLNHAFALDRGFEHYDDRPGPRLTTLLLLQLAGYHQYLRKGSRHGETITDVAIRWLDAPERRHPFFLFLNYMDAHAPYMPPPPYDRAFDSAQPIDPIIYDRSLNSLMYDRELLYLDSQVTRFLDALTSRSLLDDTVLIITADHGEAFGEHSFWHHDLALYEELIAVPLYVKSAGPSHPGISDRPMNSPGLFHLILEELRLEPNRNDPQAFRNDPQTLTAEWYRSSALTHTPSLQPDGRISIDRDLLVWFDGGRKWIASSDGDIDVYDLVADPDERYPSALTPEEVGRARARAGAWWQTHPPTQRPEGKAAELPPGVTERLRELGYGE